VRLFGRIASRGGKAYAFGLWYLTAALFFLPQVALADDIRGFLELDFSASDLKTTDLTGVASKTTANSITQRYNITMNKTLFPNLTLTGGGQFQNDMQNSATNGNKSSSSATQINPNLDLIWKTATIFSDFGYRRMEQKTQSNGSAPPATINESYTGSLGIHPIGLPPLDLIFNRSHLYDATGTSQNSQSDTLSWGSSYSELKGVDLGYSGTYLDQLNKLNGAEVQSMSQSGRVAYSRQFLDGRVFVASTYNLSTTETTFSSAGAAGSVLIPQAALNVQFATTPTTTIPFITVTSGQLQSFPGQVNLVTPVNVPPPPPGTQINLGLSFANPTRVSTLFITVTSSDPVTNSPNTRPDLSGLASFFSWDIYTSSDQGNTWVKLQTISNPPFGGDPSNPASEVTGFILNIIPVTTQLIKVVETPPQINGVIAPIHVDLNRILATRLQAFNTLQGTSVKATSTGGAFGFNSRVRLLENPNLSYDLGFTFGHGKSDQTALTTQYALINGLSLSHRFNQVFASSARVALENGTDATGISRVALTYNAALMATPIQTLSHTLVYSGRRSSIGGATDTSNSIYLNNSAELYKGVSVSAGAGTSTGTSAAGRNSQSTNISCAADIVPHQKLTLNLSFQDSISESSGGGSPSSSTSSSSETVSASFRPFEALYLSGSYSIINQTNRAPATTKNYAVGWSPFRGGDLQFNVNYSEAISSLENDRSRSLSPTVRWNIRPGAALDFSYSMSTITSGSSGSTQINSFTSSFRMSL
jgi:hypothetical protein